MKTEATGLIKKYQKIYGLRFMMNLLRWIQ
uniref:Uncharacterized protein n=1 Tax=virus sp. ctnRj46 TaxID=2826814 RepID=A0A8S5R6V4_9VIRU|nr:MAG TPA: hypothetical protein [virus sp. ctnRj46]